MYRVTKRLRSSATAHRLRNGYNGKCQNLHGHNYFFEVELSNTILDKVGMVLDFGEIKSMFDEWIQNNWDHATIVSIEDKSLYNFLKSENQRMFVLDDYLLSDGETNSTAEWMSKYLFNKFNEILNDNSLDYISLESVKVWETEDAYAEYREDK